MKRVPGKYMVWLIVLTVVAFIGISWLVAIGLNDAANRFHNRSVPTARG